MKVTVSQQRNDAIKTPPFPLPPWNAAWKTFINPFPNDKFLDSSKLKEFADDNFKFKKKGRESIQMGRKQWKWRNCSLRAISPFLTVFSKDFYCRHVKTRACLGKG